MGTVAQWGSHKWSLSHDDLRAVEKLSFSFALNTDSSTASGGKAIGSSYSDLTIVPIKFSTRLMAAVGVDVRKEIDDWRQSIGAVNPILIGGKQLGPRMQLMQVDASDVVLNGNGVMISATLSFTFQEFNYKKREKASATAGSISTSVAGTGGGISVTGGGLKEGSSTTPSVEDLPVSTAKSGRFQVGTRVEPLWGETGVITVYASRIYTEARTRSKSLRKAGMLKKDAGWQYFFVISIPLEGYATVMAIADEATLKRYDSSTGVLDARGVLAIMDVLKMDLFNFENEINAATEAWIKSHVRQFTFAQQNLSIVQSASHGGKF